MTTRRGFLQALTAAIGAVQLPAIAAAPVTVTNAGGSFVFSPPTFFDYGCQVGICLTLPNGRRHAVRTECKRAQCAPDQIARLKSSLLEWAEAQYAPRKALRWAA